jgi:hypothetical protein
MKCKQKLKHAWMATTAAALYGALPAAAQTIHTLEAEAMTLSSYAVESGNRIKLTAASGSAASKPFAGSAGTYKLQLMAIPEADGQPQVDVYRNAEKLGTFTYPKTYTATTFTLASVALAPNDTIRLVGRANGDAWARIDKVVLTQLSTTSTPTEGTNTGGTTTGGTTTGTTTPIVGGALSTVPVTIEAESMTRSSYAIESTNRIKLTASTGSAWKAFGKNAGNYKVQVQVIPETDGQPQLDVYRNGDKLKTFTYPKSTTPTMLTIDSVTLAPTDTIKLVGRKNGDAWARIDKVVFTPTMAAPSPIGGEDIPPPVVGTPPADPSACANPAGGYPGFGNGVTGGAGKAVYRVTNLSNSGAGSLRDAVSQGNRCVVFDVGGTITLSGNLTVRGANVTIDGLTAPSPGITIRGGGITINGGSGASNVVARGIRVRSAPSDAVSVYAASNVVLDRMSVSGYGDGGIDVTEKSRNVTIQWSIIGGGTASGGGNANLIGYGTTRVTSHHNLYIASNDRHPYCGVNDGATQYPSEVVCDVRNNLVWDFKVGASLQDRGLANIVNNYYYSTRAYSSGHGIWNDGTAKAYVAGNHSQNGWHINGTTQASAFAAVEPGGTTDAVTAAKAVLVQAGARGSRFGLDSTDQGYINQVQLP